MTDDVLSITRTLSDEEFFAKIIPSTRDTIKGIHGVTYSKLELYIYIFFPIIE